MRLQAATILLIVATSICRAANVNIATNLTQTHAVSKLLYGIFFEEVSDRRRLFLYRTQDSFKFVRLGSFEWLFSTANLLIEVSICQKMLEQHFVCISEMQRV